MKLTFLAGLHQVEENEATFYLLNTSPNRNRWAVTDKALTEALPTAIGKPIGCGPDYQTDRHYSNPVNVGSFNEAWKPDGYALAKATITDPEAWNRLKQAKWGPISVVITSYYETCSQCQENLTDNPDPFQHNHIRKGTAHLQVHSFRFERADFIDAPAYPQAGRIPIPLLASLYQSQPATELENHQEREEKKMSETEQLNQKIETLTAQNLELNESNQTLQTKVTSLEGQLNEIQSAKHKQLVEETLAARQKAELVDEAEKERERLEAKTDMELTDLKDDAEKIAAKLKQRSESPKAKNSHGNGDELKAAIEETRARLFGRRDG